MNSRRWHLPLQDLDDLYSPPLIIETITESSTQTTDKIPLEKEVSTNAEDNQSIMSPPAQQPTDSFISQQSEVIKNEYSEQKSSDSLGDSPVLDKSSQQQQVITTEDSLTSITIKHAFLAPFADLLNFGPPCTRGRYNPSTKAFEVIATCPFLEGTEITFFYSDDCDNVIIANYGFTHPMVPRCRTLEDWRERSELWRRYANDLKQDLDDVLEELQMLKNICDISNVDEDGDKYRDNNADQYKRRKREAKRINGGSVSSESLRDDKFIPNQPEEPRGGGIRMRQQYMEDLGL